MKQPEHTAREHLIRASHRMPGMWAAMAQARDQKFMPGMYLDDATAAVGFGNAINALPDEQRAEFLTAIKGMSNDHLSINVLMPFVTLACWRQTQGIYRFDPTIYQALIDTPLTGDLPVSVLLRLPEWCVYIETPGLHVVERSMRKRPLNGVWARINREQDGTMTLVLALDVDDCEKITHQCLPLRGTSLSAIVDEVLEIKNEADPRAKDAIISHLEPVLNLLLYLCADEADITGKRGQPANPAPRKTKRGMKLFPAEAPATWDVGVRMGSALRRAYQAAETGGGTHAGPRPHVRRAHWHGFRSGPRFRPDGSEIPTELRKFDLRWLPPIPVNLHDAGDLPATIHPVV